MLVYDFDYFLVCQISSEILLFLNVANSGFQTTGNKLINI